MSSCTVLKAEQLDASLVDVWNRMLHGHSAFRSPLLTPEFFQAVARIRDDARICVWYRDQKPIGFLPHHSRPGRFARPIGAPFSDYSALISEADFGMSGATALKMAGIDRFQAIGLMDPYALFDTANAELDEAYAIDLSPEAADIELAKKHRKNINRLMRQAQEALGPIDFVVGDRNAAHFESMVQLKRDQLHKTGLHDFIGNDWTQSFLRALFQAEPTGLHGVLVTMMAGDTPLAYHFGVRLGAIMHPWIATYDPTYARFTPGQAYLANCHEPLRQAGIDYYDLATGMNSYKKSFCNVQFPVKHACLHANSASANRHLKIAQFQALMQKPLGKGFESLSLRLHRRLDQIACLELGHLDRASGLIQAFANIGKRMQKG